MALKRRRPKWPKIVNSVRDRLARLIDDCALETLADAARLADEDGLTKDFAGNLKRLGRVRTPSSVISFDYQCFGKKTEKRLGADGAIVLSIASEGRLFEKVLFFQAKKMLAKRPRTQLRLRSGEDRRLLEQIDVLTSVRRYCAAIGLFYTIHGFYAVDSGIIMRVTDEDPSALRTPLSRRFYPGHVGDWIGHLVAPCHLGTRSPRILRELRTDGLQRYAGHRVRHIITVRVSLKNRLRLVNRLPKSEEEQDPKSYASERQGEHPMLPPKDLLRELHRAQFVERDQEEVDT